VDDRLHRDILIVSATPLIRDLLRDVFLAAHYRVLLAADGREAIEMFRQWNPSLVVADFNLPDKCATELLLDVRQEDLDAPLIVLCGSVLKRGGKVVGFLDVEAVRSASVKLGAYAVLEKPIGVDDILFTTERALKSRPTRMANR
jgi:DNA-binding NtrC family response regulator